MESFSSKEIQVAFLMVLFSCEKLHVAFLQFSFADQYFDVAFYFEQQQEHVEKGDINKTERFDTLGLYSLLFPFRLTGAYQHGVMLPAILFISPYLNRLLHKLH